VTVVLYPKDAQRFNLVKVIRNRTGLYWKPDGTWTDNWKEAKYFLEFQEAFSEVQNCNLGGVDYVLLFDDLRSREYDVVLPLRSTKS